jgi:DNA polymerase-3 subunit epsilon
MFLFRKRQTDQPAFVRAYEAGPWPDPRLPWAEVPYSVIDVETSGLDSRRDALLAIGLAEIEEGRVRLDRCWYSLIRPPEGHEVAAASIRIHGLLRDELAAAPEAPAVLRELLERLRGRALVVHVADIDVKFIDRALSAHFGGRLRGPIIDTARLAMTLHHNERLLGGAYAGLPAPAIALRGLAERFNLPIYAQHNALNDALTTAQLFLAQAHRLAQQGRATLRALCR